MRIETNEQMSRRADGVIQLLGILLLTISTLAMGVYDRSRALRKYFEVVEVPHGATPPFYQVLLP
jgi:hypothetical protein